MLTGSLRPMIACGAAGSGREAPAPTTTSTDGARDVRPLTGVDVGGDTGDLAGAGCAGGAWYDGGAAGAAGGGDAGGTWYDGGAAGGGDAGGAVGAGDTGAVGGIVTGVGGGYTGCGGAALCGGGATGATGRDGALNGAPQLSQNASPGIAA